MKRIFCVVFCLLFLSLEIDCSAATTSAKAAVLINADSGEILYSHNCDERLPMASTTKIMTALLLCEYGDLSREITVTDEMVRVEGSSMGLLPGDRVHLKDILYGMMLASGNDAANTAAIAISGSVEGFARLMNERAKEMGLENTRFVTPSGLDAEGHYTTAYELAVIAACALKNEDFAAAAASKSATLCYGNPPYNRTLTNHNRLLKSYDDVIGVKTGFTKKSGRCLVSAARRDGITVIAVTLNDPNDWQDHRALLNMGLESLHNVTVKPDIGSESLCVEGGITSSVEIRTDSVTFSSAGNPHTRCVVELPEFIYAPVNEGQVVGRVYCYKDDTLAAVEDIIATKTIGANETNIWQLFIICLKNLVSQI